MARSQPSQIAAAAARQAPAKIVRIHLQDQGQDFLWWDLERIARSLYRVIDAGPFQGWIWKGKPVTHASVKVGQQPIIRLTPSAGWINLNYPIERIEARP